MKKRLFSLLMCLAVLIISIPFAGVSVAAENTDDEEGHYLWTFEDATLNDETNGIYTADTQNNKLTLKTVADPVFPENAVASGIEAKAYVADSESTVVSKLGKALYAAGVYFELETPINLRHDAEWMIILTGRLPNGSNGTNNPDVNADTAMFAGDDCEMFIDGNGTAMSFTKTVDGTETRYKIQDPDNWSNSYRIGQNRKQTLQIWNEYNEETQKWEIHWVTQRYDGQDAWENIECSSSAISGLDFVFKTVGSQTNYFDANTWGNEIGKFVYPYLSTIEVYEDLSEYQNTPIASVPEGIVIAPVAGIAFSKTLNLGNISDIARGSVVWTDADGNQKTKAAAGQTYTATITITPNLGYEFNSDTVIPDEYTGSINEDGTLTLVRLFSVAPAEEESTSADDTAENTGKPEDTTAAPQLSSGDTTSAGDDSENGCRSSAAIGTVGVITFAATVIACKKKKKEE